MKFNLSNHILFSDNVTQPRILLNSTTGIGMLSLINVNVSNAGVYLCSSKNSITNDLEVQVGIQLLKTKKKAQIADTSLCLNRCRI